MITIKSILESRSTPPRTARELAEYLHVPYKTAWGWWSGRSTPKSEQLREQLSALVQSSTAGTASSEEMPPGEAGPAPEAKMPQDELLVQLAQARSLSAQLSARLALLGEEIEPSVKSRKETDLLLEKFLHQLYDLSEVLTFIAADEPRREAFRRRVDKTDVAYVTTLLGSLLDEQKFVLWKAFQSFPAKEAKGK